MADPAVTYRVLLVDDDADIRTLVSYVLRRAGWTVFACSTPDEALDLLAGTPVDLVLLDLALGRIDGRTVLRVVRTLPGCERIPVAFLTARVGPGEPASLALEAEVVAKPFDPRTLATQLVGVIARARSAAGTGAT